MLNNLAKCVTPIIMKDGSIYRCGTCQLCKRAKSQEWTARIIHEINTTKNKEAVFVTLTYKPKYLPKCDKNLFVPQAEGDKGGNLNPEDMRNFIKRLRKKAEKLLGKKFKYIYCGEYGGLRKRPHYHALLIGLTWQDCEKLDIKKVWGLGLVDVDKKLLTEKAIKYVLGYVRKKIGDINEEFEGIGRIKPYQRQSQGIGLAWAKRNVNKWCEIGTIAVEQHQQPVPRYYRRKIIEGEGVKIKYRNTNIYEFREEGTNVLLAQKEEKSNWCYKIVENNNGKYTKKIRHSTIRACLSQLDSNSNKYWNLFNHEYYRVKLSSEYRERYKQNWRNYKKYLKEGIHEIQEQCSKRYIRDGFAYINKNNYKRSREREMKKRVNPIYISLELQELLRREAKNKELEMLKSPYGHRDKIDRELDFIELTS